MNPKHPLDKLLHDKLSHFEDGEGSDWQQFSKKLEARQGLRKRKRRFAYLSLSLLLLLITTSVLFYFSNTNKSNQLHLNSDKNEVVINKSDSDLRTKESKIEDKVINKKEDILDTQAQASTEQMEKTNKEAVNNLGNKANEQSFTQKQTADQSSQASKNRTTSAKNGATATSSKVHEDPINLSEKTPHQLEPFHESNQNETSTQPNEATDHKEILKTPHDKSIQELNLDIQLAISEQAKEKPTPTIAESPSVSKKPLVKNKQPKLPIELGVSLETGAAFLHTSANASHGKAMHKDYTTDQNKAHRPGLQKGIGLNIKYILPQGFYLKTGFGVQQWNVEGNYDFDITEVPVFVEPTQSIDGYITLANPEHIHLSAHKEFKQFVIPLQTGFQFNISPKMLFNIETGANYHVNNSYAGNIIDPTWLIKKELDVENDLKNSYISWNFGAGVSFPLGNHFKLYVFPQYSRSVGSILKSTNTARWNSSTLNLNSIVVYRF